MTNVLSGLVSHTLIEWTEPNAFQRARSDAEGPSFRRLRIAALVASMAFIGYVATVSVPLAGRLLAVLAIIFAYLQFTQWSYRALPSRVWLTDSAVAAGIRRKNAWRWSYKDIDRCEIAAGAIDGVPRAALVIHATRGRRFVLGIAPEVDTSALRAILVEHGVSVSDGVLEGAV